MGLQKKKKKAGEEIKALYERARQEGHKKGFVEEYEEGLEEGHPKGLAEAKQK